MMGIRATTIAISFVLIVSNPLKVNADTFSTDRLFDAWMTDQCIDYCFVGMCVYLVCSAIPPSCATVTQPRVEHYWPDLLVTVQSTPADNPYSELRAVMQPVEDAALAAQSSILSALGTGNLGQAGGGSTAQPALNRDKVIRLKEANVTGNPVLIMSDVISDYTCPTDATPFQPYYSSAFDAFAWRTGITDMFTLDAAIPGRREIGSMSLTNPLGNTWGAVQPRQGFVAQDNDVKASAVIAQRAVDIVLGGGGGHVYVSPGSSGSQLGSSDGFDIDAGETFSQNASESSGGSGSDEKKSKWQMVSPKQDRMCRAFGDDKQWFNTGATDFLSYNNGRHSDRQQYAYNYWQQYSCCWPNPGVHILTFPAPRMCVPVGQ
ncbi:MAG: TIGR03756 family integrating conjugative element protein [Methyloprofundus sp.]|nr:TIGR03756 family integrating conjugative element protein [Methyloprofundus sp.]